MMVMPIHTSGAPLGIPDDPQPVDIRRLQIFVHSARGMSFAHTATALNLTPSAISHAVRALEEELSCALFKRHGPKVTLTIAGIRLLPIAEDILQRVGRLRRAVSMADEDARSLQITVPEFLCASTLARILPDFFECFPGFNVRIEISDDPGAGGGVDLGGAPRFTLGFAESEPGNRVRRNLFEGDFGFYVAPFHFLASKDRVDAGDLVKRRLLVPHAAILSLIHDHRLTEPGSHREWLLPSYESVREFARVGMGIAVLGRASAVSSVAAGQLKELPFSGARLRATCCAFWPGEMQLSWAMEALLSFIEMADGF